MTWKKTGLPNGAAGALLSIFVSLIPAPGNASQGKSGEPFAPSLDSRGPYVIAETDGASRQYREAIEEARKMHPGAKEIVFPVGDFEPVGNLFSRLQPRYAMVFMLPNELDVNFAWRWLTLSTQVDEDPFVDVRTGFITGKDSSSVLKFIRRIRTAVQNKTPLAGVMVDNFGPNTMAGKDDFYQGPGDLMIPVLGERVGETRISHGPDGFGDSRLGSMDGAGILHFGGHGYPDRVDDGVKSSQVRRLKLSPCVVFNGACYTGVTGKWYDFRDKVAAKEVEPSASFCLAMLDNNVLGYLAALHPDHGIPVYQEMEFMATDGASLGDIIKHTHDGVILANGGKLPLFRPLTNGDPSPNWTPADYMLRGTASRVLFGDPALALTPAFTPPAFEVTCKRNSADSVQVTAVLKNTNLMASFTDTYYSDLSAVPNLFNDRALISCKLPDDWKTVGRVGMPTVSVKGKIIKCRLQGFGVEDDAGSRTFHAQIDLPTTDYMESEFRVAGARVELNLSR